MNDEPLPGPISPVADLEEGLVRLDRLIGSLFVSAEHLLHDLAVVDFSCQVLEGAEATLLLHRSDTPHVAWVTARQAFESMHDLFYLLQLCPDRLSAGARVYVGTLFAKARARGLLDWAAREAQLEAGEEQERAPGLREFVRQEAEEVEAISPGSKAAIMNALDVRLQGGDHHWSGLSRKELSGLVRKELKGFGTAAMFEAYYYALSTYAHPRLRLGETVFFDGQRVQVRLSQRPPNEMPCSIALACILTAEEILKLHLGADDAR